MATLLPVRGVGAKGIVRDISPVLLPADTWSDGVNVRFDNESVSKIAGHSSMFDLSFEPDLIAFWPRPTNPVYLAAGGQNVVLINAAGNESDITGSTTFTARGSWQHTLVDGGRTIVLNNGVDIPQYITFGTTGSPEETSLQPLPGWPSDTRAAVIRSVGDVLMAGNLTVTVSGVPDPRPGQLMISSQAARLAGVPNYGNVPTSWTFEVGVTRSEDTVAVSKGSPIVDIVDFRGYGIVVTGNSLHRVQYATTIAGATIVDTVNEGNGALSINCISEFDGRLFAVDNNDVYLSGGSGDIQSVIDHKMRVYFANNLNDEFSDNVFITRNLLEDEMWICYPTVNSTDGRCDEALLWNYRQNSWSRREMPASRSATFGPSSNGAAFLMSDEHIVFTGQPGTLTGISDRVHLGDSTTQFDGVDFDYYVERVNIDMGSVNASKWTGILYPIMSGTGNSMISLLPTNTAGASIDLTSVRPLPFDVVNDYKVDPRLNGRFLSIRFAGSGTSNWILDGYTLSVDIDDRR